MKQSPSCALGDLICDPRSPDEMSHDERGVWQALKQRLSSSQY